MKTDPLKQAAFTENGAGFGTVTQEMVRERATELAFINERSEKDMSVFDLERPKCELTGETDIDPKEAILEQAPESERWEPVAGSTGYKVDTTSDEDEDGEGLSDSERLVEEGVSEAEHDQMVQAAKAEQEEDKRQRQQ